MDAHASVGALCPFCMAAVAGDAQECPGCGAVHHRDCYEANGKCAVLGCEVSVDSAAVEVPADDPSFVPLPPPPPTLGQAGPVGASHASGTPMVVPVPSAQQAYPPAPPAPVAAPVPAAPIAVPVPQAQPVYSAAQPDYLTSQYYARMKSQGVVIALALLLGGFGAHRFYLGDTKNGVIFLVLLVVGLFLVLPLIGVWIWAIVDAINSRSLAERANQELWARINAEANARYYFYGPTAGGVR